MSTPFEDIETLRTTSFWPHKTIPAWAAKAAEKLQCGPTAGAVIEIGLRNEIQRLQELLEAK